VHGAITGKDFYLGNLRLTEEHFNCPSEIKATVQGWKARVKQLFYSMMVSKCLGCSLLLILLKTAAVKRLNNFMNLALNYYADW
jgi:Cd2+/Zn2+-exporting ATPase